MPQHNRKMPSNDLTPDDRADLTALLRETLAVSPVSPRTRRLRALLDKLDPQPVREMMPPPKPPVEPGLALRSKRRR